MVEEASTAFERDDMLCVLEHSTQAEADGEPEQPEQCAPRPSVGDEFNVNPYRGGPPTRFRVARTFLTAVEAVRADAEDEIV